MKSMIKDIKNIKVKKEVIHFDENDKKITETVTENCYLVTMLNGNSVSLTKKQLKEFNINEDCTIINVDNEEDYEDEDVVTEKDTNNSKSSPKFSTNIQKEQKVISSSKIKGDK